MPNKIYVLDDNITLTSLMDFVLSSEGYIVKSSNNADEAMKELLQFQPDLILLDWMMPNVSGKDILEMLNVHSKLKHIPIFLMTGMAENLEINPELSDIQIIEKPFDHDELMNKIKDVLYV